MTFQSAYKWMTRVWCPAVIGGIGVMPSNCYGWQTRDDSDWWQSCDAHWWATTISSFVQFLPETCYILAHVQMLRYLLTYDKRVMSRQWLVALVMTVWCPVMDDKRVMPNNGATRVWCPVIGDKRVMPNNRWQACDAQWLVTRMWCPAMNDKCEMLP